MENPSAIRMARFLPALLALSLPCPIYAQQLRGVVRDSASAAPIVGAELSIRSLQRVTRTLGDGAFTLADLRAGTYLIEIRYPGFTPLRDTITFTQGARLERDFTLTRTSATLDTVRSTATVQKYRSPNLRGFEERRAAGFGYFIPDSVMRMHDNDALNSLLLQRLPNVVLARGSGGSAYLMTNRKRSSGPVFLAPKNGQADCYVTLYIDGVLTWNYRMDTLSRPDMNQIEVNQFAGVEFHASSATLPAWISHTNADCGVLLLWSREK
jgi:hypothetical protein